MKKLEAILLLIFAITLVSCTRKTENSTLKITLPAGVISQNISVQSDGTEWNTSLNPVDVSEINCYGVFVGGPEAPMNAGYCSIEETSTVKFRFGRARFFIPAGNTVEIEVPSGPARRIILVGLRAQNGACVNLGPQQDPDGANLSVPHIVGETVRDLPPGAVSVNIGRTLNASEYFNDCRFPGEGIGSGSGGNGLNFGSGSDGSHSIDAAVSDVGTDNTVISGRTLAAARRITNISNANGRDLTLSGGFSAQDFVVGDEVMWVVSASGDGVGDGSVGGPDAACTGNSNGLHRGRYAFARITATANPVVTLDKPVYDYVSVRNAALSNAQFDMSGNDFCRMQLMRVPNFENLTINSNGTVGTPSWDGNVGGFFVLKVNGTLSLNSDFNLWSTSRGFAGGVPGTNGMQGSSSTGSGAAVPGPNDTGGGGASGSGPAGGGANGGAGAAGNAGSGSSGGNAVTWCFGPCKPSDKLLMGSGGGGGVPSAAWGGAGGGVLVVLARNISTNGYMLIAQSSGGWGASAAQSSGGGAGGNVLVVAHSVTGTGTVGLYANGGDGGGAVGTGGGAGGGGMVEYRTCDRTGFTGTEIFQVFAGGAVNGSTAGSSGGASLDINGDPMACSLPP